MYISEPYKGLVYYAAPRLRWSKYLWRAVECTTLTDKSVDAARVPRRIRKQAYAMIWRDRATGRMI
jgi:hypothetical protein